MKFNSKDYLYYTLLNENKSSYGYGLQEFVEKLGEFYIEPGSLVVDKENEDWHKQGVICDKFTLCNSDFKVDHIIFNSRLRNEVVGHYNGDDKVRIVFDYNNDKDRIIVNDLNILDQELLLSCQYMARNGLARGFDLYDAETVKHLINNYGLSTEELMNASIENIRRKGFLSDATYGASDIDEYESIISSSSAKELKKKLCLEENKLDIEKTY